MSEDAFVLLLLSYSFYELGCLGTLLVFRFFSPSYLLFLVFLLSICSSFLFYFIFLIFNREEGRHNPREAWTMKEARSLGT